MNKLTASQIPPASAGGQKPSSPSAAVGGWQDQVPTGLARPTLFGAAVAALFLLGFGVWAALAPLSGAVVAAGVVQASGQNKVVEHLEGGIIASINVREGEAVTAGQVLLSIDTTRLTVDRNRVNVALIATQAQLARAEAERDGRSELQFSPEISIGARIAGVEGDLDQQRAEFSNRLQRHRSELAAVEQRVNAAGDEIAGLQIQKTSEQRKLEVLRSELADKQTLLKQGLTPRSQVNTLQRAEADSLGALGSITANIGQKKSAIAELGEQSAGLEAKRREAASSEVNELRAKIGDLREQMRTRDDILARSEIRAPDSGIIVKLAKNTVGSIIKPGEPVVELLPTGGDLIIDAKVPPQDVDSVKVGQDANLRFTALNARTTPEVAAKVTYISADRLLDPDTREPYYSARLEITGDLPVEIKPGQIQPGMPVDAFIKTGDRTFLEYLVRPVQDSFAKAFREE